MSDDFGSDYLTITDDEGNEFELEVLDTIEFEGKTYKVFLPAGIDTMDVNDPDYGLIILESTEENGEEVFSSVDDEAELNAVYNLFMAQLFPDEGSDGDSDETKGE